MQKEQLSALMDGEVLDSELISSLSKDRALQQTWQSYHLTRDALRGDMSNVVYFDIADRVAVALENEPVRLVPQSATESQPQPAQWRNMPFWNKVRPWVSQVTQIGVAACVSLAVLVGIQQYNRSDNSISEPESPVFNTLPIGGQASQVSFGVPNDGSNSAAQQQLQQRKRINAILQDYELQRRLHNEQMQLDRNNTQASVQQVPGTLSLGTQQQ